MLIIQSKNRFPVLSEHQEKSQKSWSLTDVDEQCGSVEISHLVSLQKCILWFSYFTQPQAPEVNKRAWLGFRRHKFTNGLN